MKRSLIAALLLAASLGCGGEQGRAKKAGRRVGETVTDFAQGIGSGIDKRLEVEVELSPNVIDLGLTKTVAKTTGIDGNKKGITVYLLSQRPITGRLVAKALNAEGAEIGRSPADVEFTPDDAKYVTFEFGEEMDRQLVERYVIDAKPTPPSAEN